MVLLQLVSALAPDWYAESNAGAASYPLADDGERRFGVRGFLQWASGDPMLRDTRYYAHLERLPSAGGLDTYLGSPGFVLNELAERVSYVLCDTDPDCVDDLNQFVARAGSVRPGWITGRGGGIREHRPGGAVPVRVNETGGFAQ